MTIAAEDQVKALEKRVSELESELKAAKSAQEQAEERAEEAEGKVEEVEGELHLITGEANDMAHRLENTSQYVWLNDRPGAAYCRACGRTYPIHNHDCPFGEIGQGY